jgi:hypothetical protein
VVFRLLTRTRGQFVSGKTFIFHKIIIINTD